MTKCGETGCNDKATHTYKAPDGLIIPLCDKHYKEWKKHEYKYEYKRWPKMLLAFVLVLSIIVCFLPWLKMDAAITGEEPIKREIYGYDYIAPLGAPYTAPVAILNIIGFILSAYSFKQTKRIKMLNVVAGILILVGVAASFGYTTSVAFADVSNKGGSFNAWGDYGMGLEALLGFLMIIIGVKQKPGPE